MESIYTQSNEIRNSVKHTIWVRHRNLVLLVPFSKRQLDTNIEVKLRSISCYFLCGITCPINLNSQSPRKVAPAPVLDIS